jgi:oligoendopeptidase F
MEFLMNWNISTIFPQFSLQSFIDSIKDGITALEKSPASNPLQLLLELQKLQQKICELQTYAHCLVSENTQSEKGSLLESQVQHFHAATTKIHTKISFAIKELSSEDYSLFLQAASREGLSFTALEMHSMAKVKLSEPLESLITDLAIDGYHGFSQVFSTLHGNLTFNYKEKRLSFGQLENYLHDPEEIKRKEAFSSYQQVFLNYKQHFAHLLNHIAGFRLEVYKKRKWDSVLFEPLLANRMGEKTLKAMWACVTKHQSIFAKYLQKKAELLSKDKLSWYDIEIPLFATKKLTPYDKGCKLILKQIGKYGHSMEAFCQHALTNCWVEAENRAHKAAGGFCSALPIKKESRIFMTYLGTDSNISTLAHELGHAYHNHQIFHHPFLSQDIKMNVAETASTMFELIVSRGLLQEAKSKEEKLALLDDKITRSIAFFMNIQARFLFETRFYQERKQGFVSAERLSHLMEMAQKEAYCHALEDYNPLFWASKMHFYFTDVPFYNFPYTFGYLFSLGLFSFLSKNPEDFEKNYNALLCDTPLMTTEELAKKHLGISLESSEFWELAMQEAIKDVNLFLELI